jgi:TPP-dependent pyruvate/acetoin dehydrogenase alpha subunit
VEGAARRAVEAVRENCFPSLLEIRTYRFRAHSMADPDLYRTKGEIERWKERDPIKSFEARLREMNLLSDDDRSSIEQAVASEIDEAVRFAEAGPLEPIEDLAKDVYTALALKG